jgi:hypothetical protein
MPRQRDNNNQEGLADSAVEESIEFPGVYGNGAKIRYPCVQVIEHSGRHMCVSIQMKGFVLKDEGGLVLEGFVVIGSPFDQSPIEGVVVEVVVVVGFVMKWPLPLNSQFVIFCGCGTKFTGQPK